MKEIYHILAINIRVIDALRRLKDNLVVSLCASTLRSLTLWEGVGQTL